MGLLAHFTGKSEIRFFARFLSSHLELRNCWFGISAEVSLSSGFASAAGSKLASIAHAAWRASFSYGDSMLSMLFTRRTISIPCFLQFHSIGELGGYLKSF